MKKVLEIDGVMVIKYPKEKWVKGKTVCVRERQE